MRRCDDEASFFFQPIDKCFCFFGNRIFSIAERASIADDDLLYFFRSDNFRDLLKDTIVVGNNAAWECNLFARERKPHALRTVVYAKVPHRKSMKYDA